MVLHIKCCTDIEKLEEHEVSISMASQTSERSQAPGTFPDKMSLENGLSKRQIVDLSIALQDSKYHSSCCTTNLISSIAPLF